jgi:subtilisin family serine protease
LNQNLEFLALQTHINGKITTIPRVIGQIIACFRVEENEIEYINILQFDLFKQTFTCAGEGFAMVSGTSMAAPHIAGIAALIKQKHPRWSPAAIKSALLTTSTTLDRAGNPILAQQYSETEAMNLVRATPFDYGNGHVNPKAALDPGLIFDAG